MKERKKPKGADKSDEDPEVLDITADVSAGEEKEVVRIRILKYDFGPKPDGKKGGKKKAAMFENDVNVGERCQCWRTMSKLEGRCGVGWPLCYLKLGPRPDQFTS